MSSDTNAIKRKQVSPLNSDIICKKVCPDSEMGDSKNTNGVHTPEKINSDTVINIPETMEDAEDVSFQNVSSCAAEESETVDDTQAKSALNDSTLASSSEYPETQDLLGDVHEISESTSLEESSEEGEDIQIEEQTWRGTSIEELVPVIPLSELPRVSPSHSHKILYRIPYQANCVPRPEPPNLYDAWIKDHVRMPYSVKSKYPVRGVPDSFKNRWEMIEEALKEPITNSEELEAAILYYNHTYGHTWDFGLLHHLLNVEFAEEETEAFFQEILPRIVELALRLPTLVTQPVPLLLRGFSAQLSLSQLQIGSLLANAFLCTFPRRNSASQRSNGEYANFPDINFNRLFRDIKSRPINSSLQKLKCLITYFRRITNETPVGTVSFSRRQIAPNSMPFWCDSTQKMTRLHVSSTGTIEDDGTNMLQVDFANRMVGGGVLGTGCVQEEIRFVICPELIVSRLFTECLDDNEALVISGVEQYSCYKGYARTFEWVGPYKDETSRDSSGRMHCSLVAIDALPFHNHTTQFNPNKVTRELNKAYVGFQAQEPVRTNSSSSPKTPHSSMPIATGNWGCGAFQGDKRLKAVLQLMAAAEAGRDVAYFTFGDRVLRDELAELHALLREHAVTVGRIFQALVYYNSKYRTNGRFSCNVFTFLLAKFTPGATLPPEPPQPRKGNGTLSAFVIRSSKSSSSDSHRPGPSFECRPAHSKTDGLDKEKVREMLEESTMDSEIAAAPNDSSTLKLQPSVSREKPPDLNTDQKACEPNVSNASSSKLSTFDRIHSTTLTTEQEVTNADHQTYKADIENKETAPKLTKFVTRMDKRKQASKCENGERSSYKRTEENAKLVEMYCRDYDDPYATPPIQKNKITKYFPPKK